MTDPGGMQAVSKPVSILACLASAWLAAGCITHEPMPQEVYSEQHQTLFTDIPDALKSRKVDVLYATDRAMDEKQDVLLYGHDRSPALAFGAARVDLGKDLSWDDLIAWTTTRDPAPEEIRPAVDAVTEIVKLPPSPYAYTFAQDGQIVLDPGTSSKRKHAQNLIQDTIRSRLDLTERKTVDVQIHGINEHFDETLIQLAVGHHMYGRRGVPLLYSWPAGEPTLLQTYTRDRESGEFTIFHLKELIKTIAVVGDVEQINISAHSRGTDVVLTALRELVIEARAARVDPRTVLKINNLVLIAPDLDIEVTSQRVTAEALSFAVGRVTLYVNDSDTAISASTLLFASDERLGGVDPSELTERQKQTLKESTNIDVVFYSGREGGFLGHSYYRAPVILADIFLLYDGKLPGARHGRPLKPLGDSMWAIDDAYLK